MYDFKPKTSNALFARIIDAFCSSSALMTLIRPPSTPSRPLASTGHPTPSLLIPRVRLARPECSEGLRGRSEQMRTLSGVGAMTVIFGRRKEVEGEAVVEETVVWVKLRWEADCTLATCIGYSVMTGTSLTYLRCQQCARRSCIVQQSRLCSI